VKEAGLSILLAEQNLHFAQALGERAFVIESGHLRWSGGMAELAADADLRAAHLAL
jgi:branched-chain amino acid transport system ATP-binding protein